MEMGPTINTVVLSGGGIKGMEFGPFFNQLSDAGLYNSFSTVIGSSVGGLTASMLAFGFNAKELEEFLTTGGEGLMDLFSVPDVLTEPDAFKMISSLAGKGGAAKGLMLYHKAQGATKQALGDINATFADLAKKIGQQSPSGGTYRDLELTVTVSDPKRGSYQIVCSPRTTPNMPIALAMRMTASLPIAFPSVRITQAQLREYTQGATEPLVKYHRTPSKGLSTAKDLPEFPTFNPTTFYNGTPEEKQKIIDDIREDLLQYSLQNGELVCTDGGVVDNLPIYLATDKPGGLDETIALDFEEPWKKKIREANTKLYIEGKKISKEDEEYYSNKVLEPHKNDRVYYQMQRTVHHTRPTQSYMLTLLSKGNLLAFDVGDITADDFELKSAGTPWGLTHDQKVTYLLSHGYAAGKVYLEGKGVPLERSFHEMYPQEALKEAPVESTQTKIETNEAIIHAWEQILAIIMTKTHGEKHDVETFIFTNIMEIRKELQKAKGLSDDRDKAAQVLDLINHVTVLTADVVPILVEAKIKCDIAFRKLADSLNVIDKRKFKVLERSNEAIAELSKTSPELVKTFDKLIKLQESSRLFEEMLSLVRDKSVLATPAKPTKTTVASSVKDTKDTRAETFQFSGFNPLKSISERITPKEKKVQENASDTEKKGLLADTQRKKKK